MDLPFFSAAFAALAITLYVMLDRFDLGVGALLLTETSRLDHAHVGWKRNMACHDRSYTPGGFPGRLRHFDAGVIPSAHCPAVVARA